MPLVAPGTRRGNSERGHPVYDLKEMSAEWLRTFLRALHNTYENERSEQEKARLRARMRDVDEELSRRQ